MSDKLRAVGILQKQLMGVHYARALDAKRDGRPIVYVTAMFPVEIVKAFEPHIATVYPENHAAMLNEAILKAREGDILGFLRTYLEPAQ